jgi:hypothetical protein
MLARAGYSSLEQVDSTSDCVILAIPGMGIGRLTAVRHLVRPDWQPPQPRLVKVVERFLSAARFALRFWSIDDLEAVIQGSVALPSDDRPVEKRLSLEQFAQSTRKALRHCQAEELVQALHQASAGPGTCVCPPHDHPLASSDLDQPPEEQESAGSVAKMVSVAPNGGATLRESDRFAHPQHKRLEIVHDYRAARERGLVQNKDSWARSHYQISGKTLLSYEREFPER